jgi:DNA-binding NtrC family response regulator
MSNRHEGMIVFVVDDEHIIASTLAMILNSNGFDARSFTDPLKALRAAHFGTPDVLVSDVAMPFLSGVELAAKIKAFCPDCKVLLFSGEVGHLNLLVHDSAGDRGFEILQKPVHPVALLQRIQELLDSPSVPTSWPARGETTSRRAYKKL